MIIRIWPEIKTKQGKIWPKAGLYEKKKKKQYLNYKISFDIFSVKQTGKKYEAIHNSKSLKTNKNVISV